MEIQVKMHVNAEEAKEVTQRLVKHNLENKLDNYLKKFSTKDDAEGIIELKVDKNKKTITLNLEIDTNFTPLLEYFEIFTDRMVFCRPNALNYVL